MQHSATTMPKFFRLVFAVLALGALTALAGCGGLPMGKGKEDAPLKGELVSRLKSIGSSPAEPMVIRIFKESSELEVWKRSQSGSFKLVKSYQICAWSGGLGPKIKEGDRQSPEGFYNITPGLMNPNSNYYLSFNTGFPNKFDRVWGRTGSDLMVHGDCSSRGCYSMTDEGIAEIYALARESFKGGNPVVQLQIFPFRMTPQNLAKHASDPSFAFWKNIKDGYDRFEIARVPPTWDVCNKQYVFGVADGQVLNAGAACPAGASVRTAALDAKQSADNAALDAEIARLASADAKAKAAADQEAAATAAAKARGEAIGGFVSGLMGGAQPADKVVDPTAVAPTPAPPKQRG